MTHFKNRSTSFWLKSNELYLVGLVLLVALLLGVAGFYQLEHQRKDFLTILYLAFQLLTLESGAPDTVTVIPWTLQVARWLAPGALAYAALKAIWSALNNYFYLLKLGRLKSHVIICGLGEKGKTLVESFLKKNAKIVIIEKDKRNELVLYYKSKGVFVIHENAVDSFTLKKAGIEDAEILIAATGNDLNNLEIVKETKTIKTTTPSRIFSKAFAHVDHYQLKLLLQESELIRTSFEKLDARIFNVYENGARLLLHYYSPDRFCKVVDESDPPVHILVVGFERLGEALLTQLARVAHYLNYKKTVITVIDQDLDWRAERYFSRFESIQNIIDVRFISTFPEYLQEKEFLKIQKDQPISIVYFCLEDEIKQALALMRIRLLMHNQVKPLIVNIAAKTPVSLAIREDEHIYPVQLMDQACTSEMVIDETLDILARSIHKDYLERELPIFDKKVKLARQQNKQIPEAKASMVIWSKLSEEYKESNRSQAAHIDIKLRSIGCERCPKDDSRAEFDFTKDREMILKLAKMEHLRWNADRWLAGWKLGERDDTSKRHPNLVPWEELDQGTKDYDIDAMRHIPKLLARVEQKVYRL